MQAIINATNKLFGEIQKEVVAIDGLTEEQILAIGNIFSKIFPISSRILDALPGG